jgi:pyruvate ferredoxin oxidoreductase beta subunit
LAKTHEAGDGRDLFFAQPPADGGAALELAARIIGIARELPAGVHLLVASSPLALGTAELSAAELLGLIPAERLQPALGVVSLMRRLSGEVKRGEYLLDELADEVARLPACVASSDGPLAVLAGLRERGLRIGGLPADTAQAREALLRISRDASVSLEYLLGNLQKAETLLKRFGVRDQTLNASALFHNAMSGFLIVDLDMAGAATAVDIVGRAAGLERQGTRLTVFRNGDFNTPASKLSADEMGALARETGDVYGVPVETFLRFLGALLGEEEARLAAAAEIGLVELLQTFKFATTDRDLVSRAAVARAADPTRWQETALGSALMALRHNLDWVSVSAGVTAAGELDATLKAGEARAAAEALQKDAKGRVVTLTSGRGGVKREHRINELATDDLLFDLYCLAVLERRSLADVLASASGVLSLFRSLENTESPAHLDELVSARLAGRSHASILASQGLVLGNSLLAESLARLKTLADKVKLTVEPGDGPEVPVERASLADFRKAVLSMSRAPGLGNSPERVLALLRDKIVPEIKRLPKAVIAQRDHGLARLVEQAAAGVPARYALRRPWKRINLDPLAYMGSCLEAGIRNCLGCPVNTLYGLVNKTALASGFEEVITYEATGCFEVYSGIWPYTGKKGASLHGVFGGAPSELLGGLAARKARLKHAHKVNGEQGAAYRANLKRTLHLGWGGDGATFDIGFGNLSGLFSRLQKLSQDALDQELDQRALYVCYDNEGYQNTGNQYSAASSPGGNTTTNPQGQERPIGNDLRKKHIVEIMAEHGASVSARMNIHRQEHIIRVTHRALEDGIDGAFLHFLQPCTTGWKFTADSLTYDLAYLSEEGGLFAPVTFEHGVPYLEMYPTPRNPGDNFLKLQARFKHLLGAGAAQRKDLQRIMDYYAQEWLRNLQLCGYEGEIPYADRLGYLELEHRSPRVKV